MLLAALVCLLLFSTNSHAISAYRFYSDAEIQPRIAIIIDDIGYSIALGQRTIALQGNLTLAVLPQTPGATLLAKAGHASGKEIMLHAPMSNHSDVPLGPGGLTPDMSKAEFMQVLSKSIDSIPHIRGVNNHMGSELTTRRKQMQWVMEELKHRDLYFIDSLTDSNSVALKTARKNGIISQRRDIFLDHFQNEADIEHAFQRLLERAKDNGFAIGIGHPHPETLNVLERLLPQLEQHNVELVHVSELLQIN